MIDSGDILMGKDCDPWQFRNFNCASNVGSPMVAKQSTNPMVFPAYADPYGIFHLNSALMPLPHPTGLAAGQKRFMVFDRSGDQTNLIYSSFGSQFPYPYPTSDLPVSNETNVSNGNVNEEMHEDTEEIDALLYSDSDNEYEEEEASTGHSPVETTTRNYVDDEEEEVASSAVLQPPPPPAKREVASSAVLQPPPPPAKRRRIEPELDPSLADTASSTHCGGIGNANGNEDRKKTKREKIQETVGALRRIIPGSKGRDATAVLDEAIRYLKSMRLKAKGLGVATALK